MAFDFEVRRRRFMVAGAAAMGGVVLPAVAQKFQPAQDIRPLIEKITGGIVPEKRDIEIELPQLAENGNSVPMRVRVASPMSDADHVKAIYIFAERNPRPLVATFRLGPYSGRAEIATRVRLAGTQTVTVLAELSGNRFRIGPADVLVTTAACLDESNL
jgi:sulfur-oxidizing protein SoxY